MLKTPSSTVIGGAFWTPDAVMLGSDQSFDQIMKRLFANNEQGAYLDPNDLSTMFQDAAGTIPVTGAGQPIGLVLDKSKGLVLGGELIIGGSFEDGLIGTKSEGMGSVSTWELNTTDPISGTKDGKLTITTASATRPTLRFPVASNAVVGKTYRLTFNYKVTSGVAIISQLNNGSSATTVVNKTLTGSGTFVASIPWQGESTVQPYIYFGESIATIQIDNVSFKELVGNHTYQTVSASRPILRKNAVTGANYLEFDGSDDFLQTSNVDFTSTDKVSLFTGVRKLSDAARSMLVELSLALATNVFHLEAPVVAGLANYTFVSAGSSASSAVYTNSIVAAPVSNVITAQGKIGDNLNILRVNGSQKSSATASQGTGNYGNYPLFIGRRAGTSLPFNGHVYGLIVLGRLATDTETAAIEKEFAKRMGVTLSV